MESRGKKERSLKNRFIVWPVQTAPQELSQPSTDYGHHGIGLHCDAQGKPGRPSATKRRFTVFNREKCVSA